MKIAVVAAARSRSKLLSLYLHSLNPELSSYDEHYTFEINKGNTDLESITKSLVKENNYITKIMGHNLVSGYSPEVFEYKVYDQIHLIERYNFFDQCCSVHVSKNTGIWHLMNTDTLKLKQHVVIKKQHFTLTRATIQEQSQTVAKYLTIKKYLLDNDIPFTLHTYNEAVNYSVFQSKILPNDINYQSIITNYHLKDRVNSLFNEYFCYENAESDLESFIDKLSTIL